MSGEGKFVVFDVLVIDCGKVCWVGKVVRNFIFFIMNSIEEKFVHN